MKKSTMIALIIAGSLFGIGIVICVIAGIMTGFRFDKTVFNSETPTVVTFDIKDEFDDIDIHTVSDDIEILMAEGSKCTVTCTDTENVKHKAEVKDGKLTISEENNSSWLKINFFVVSPEKKTKVYLPEGTYRNLKINTTSGDVSCRDKFTFSSMDIVTVSGEIGLSGTKTLETLNMNTTSGDIAISGTDTPGLTISTVSGDISLNNSAAGKKIGINTTSGDINILQPLSSDINISTISGDVKGTMSGYSISHETVSGDVKLPGKNNGDKKCYIKTVSGDIFISEAE